MTYTSRALSALSICALLTACNGGSSPSSLPTGSSRIAKTVASMSITTTATVTLGIASTLNLAVTATNASGHTISGTYATPITLSDSDTTGSTQLSVTNVTSSTTAVTLTYNGSGSFKGATISGQSGGVVSGTGSLAVAGGTCGTVSSGGNTVQGYYPCMLQNAYNLNISTGTGQTVAVVDAYDDPNAESDLAFYRSTFGLSVCSTANGCFKKVNQTGGSTYPVANTGWAGEISLDLDMVSAVCPNCHILLVEANSNANGDLYASEDEAVTLGATEVSNSWSGAEFSGETADDADFDHPGVPITVAAGDNGYSDNTGAASPQYPTVSPYVTAVGGTSLTPANNARGWNETVWNEMAIGDGATGSGCSIYEAKPTWQTDTGCTKRVYNDVAAVGDPVTGLAVYDTYPTGGWSVVGGTSAATPIVAAEYALAGNGATINNGSYPYAHASDLYDITSGNDITGDPSGPVTCPVGQTYVCVAGVGYDGPSGMGAPNGAGGMLALRLSPSQRAAMLQAAQAVMVPPNSRTRPFCGAATPGHMTCHAIEVIGAH